MKFYLVFVLLMCSVFSCKSRENTMQNQTPRTENMAPPPAIEGYELKVLRSFPHDTSSYVQGLLYFDGKLYESAGLIGKSSVRIVDYKTGEVIKKVRMPLQYFAEGLAESNGKLYQITWQNEEGFVRDPKTLEVKSKFTYAGEGWGITNYKNKLIMSDGTNNLKIFEPESFKLEKYLAVTREGAPLTYLNELEMAGDKLYANIYGDDDIAVIDPGTGSVEAVIDCGQLRRMMPPLPFIEVMNGIAYIPENDSFILTGKNWTHYFECKFVKR